MAFLTKTGELVYGIYIWDYMGLYGIIWDYMGLLVYYWYMGLYGINYMSYTTGILYGMIVTRVVLTGAN
jgi:hypothetical protein